MIISMVKTLDNKLDYESFVQYIRDEIPEYLPQYAIKDVVINMVPKNNGIVFAGVCVMLEDSSISPTLYLECYYDSYKKGKGIEETVSEIAREYNYLYSRMNFDLDDIKGIGCMDENIFLRVVNYDKNKEQLENCPHIRFLDLAVTFRRLVSIKSGGISSALILNEEFKLWNIDIKDAYDIALENTMKLFPPVIEKLDNVLADMGVPITEMGTGTGLYILTNESKINGASVILYTGIFEKYVEEFGGDIYIIPSSVHELLLISVNGYEYDKLLETIRYVNENSVSELDYLGENLYRYDAELKEILL